MSVVFSKKRKKKKKMGGAKQKISINRKEVV